MRRGTVESLSAFEPTLTHENGAIEGLLVNSIVVGMFVRTFVYLCHSLSSNVGVARARSWGAGSTERSYRRGRSLRLLQRFWASYAICYLFFGLLYQKSLCSDNKQRQVRQTCRILSRWRIIQVMGDRYAMFPLLVPKNLIHFWTLTLGETNRLRSAQETGDMSLLHSRRKL